MTDVFQTLADRLSHQIDAMINSDRPLVRMAVSGDDLWDLYLESIPDEHNPIFRINRVYDANYDKHFIRHLGNMALINEDFTLTTIWDVDTEGLDYFEPVVNLLNETVCNASIDSIFLEEIGYIGHKPSKDSHDASLIWTHFFYPLPNQLIIPKGARVSRETKMEEIRSTKQVFERSMLESTMDDLDTLLDLAAQNAVYRLQEQSKSIQDWKKEMIAFQAIPEANRDAYLWERTITVGNRLRFRNTVYGTIVTDLYKGVDLETAVKSYETKMAPANYKRPTALVTPKMIAEAKETLSELGLLSSLQRRFATQADIPANHYLFTSQAKKAMDIFDDLVGDAKASTAKVDVKKAEEITLDELLALLPEVDTLELLPTRALVANQVVLTTAADTDSQPIFRWNNPFSWAYVQNGGAADAIKERVKAAGGRVDGDLRVSLSWSNYDDLDLHIKRLGRPQEIYYGNRRNFGGHLDVDQNAGGGVTREPVENIIFADSHAIPDGNYMVYVNQFSRREKRGDGFQVQIENKGVIETVQIPHNPLGNGQNVRIATFAVTRGQVSVTFENGLKVESDSSISEDSFITVDHMLLSPNYWEEPGVGNKHVILTTKDFTIENPVHGFFNEQLNSRLTDHRKVMSVLAGKLLIEEDADTALRGYGFSSTMDNQFIVRVIYANGRRRILKVAVK